MSYTIRLLLVGLVLLGGCEADRMSERGFSLPEGSELLGREAFEYLHCHECHTVAGETFPLLPDAEPYVELGGKVSSIKTYGQLVTSIINPSHKLASKYPREVVSQDGESNMPNYNGVMTVQELTDIVMFLQPKYEVVVPQTYYRPYL